MLLGLLLAIGTGLLLGLGLGQGSIDVPSYFSQGRMPLRYAMSQSRVLSGSYRGISSV